MNWIIAATVSAVLFTVLAVISKEMMDHISTVDFTAIYSLVAFIFYTPFFIYYTTQGGISVTYLVALLILLSGIGNVLGMLAYNYGLKNTSISTAMPLNRVQPVIVAVIGYIALSEAMNPGKVAGIMLVTAASYIILLEDHRNPLDPVKNLHKDKGAQLALVSALVFSITSVIDRYVTTNLQPEIYTYFILGTMTATLLTYTSRKEKNIKEKITAEITSNKAMYALSGLFTAAAYLTLYQAFSQAEASKVVPILQLQVPLTVIAGKEIFDETHILQKLFGSAILTIGIILVL